ncbi:MAG: ribonuclease Y [Gemmatimonadales bacterium]|nr:MAG: ribonuclease Y [Gemmatimonadales bacterium]
METHQALVLVASTLALVLGAVLGFLGGRSRERAQREQEKARGEDEASRIVERAQSEARSLQKEGELAGREEAVRLREAWEREEARRREELEKLDTRLSERAESLERKFDSLDERERGQEARLEDLRTREARVARFEEEAEQRLEAARRQLESLAGLSAEEARQRLVSELEDEARADAAHRIRELRDEAERTAHREAKKVIALAIQRMAADESVEGTVSVVQLPSDDMKGRIIGREGRNIRAFEQATGIDVIIDDTPEAVVLSGFDPIRREVARMAMERLVEDGRIHPGRIEEMVEKSRGEVDEGMREVAEEALYDLGIHDLNPEIVKVLGRLRFRTSYGQNQLRHSIEVARLAGMMAAEMGLDVQLAKRAGLLHDVGKGMTHEHEGTHVELGWELCRRYGEPDVVLNAIRAHHDEEPHRYPEAFLVTAADAISGARPGARREMFDTYVKRLERLEALAMEFEGVERCFAVQAGREVRVMVEPDRVSDEEMRRISERVARRFEEELQYPGQIKVVVVRETRAVDFAR